MFETCSFVTGYDETGPLQECLSDNYTVSHKMRHFYFYNNWQMSTDFNNSFIEVHYRSR